MKTANNIYSTSNSICIIEGVEVLGKLYGPFRFTEEMLHRFMDFLERYDPTVYTPFRNIPLCSGMFDVVWLEYMDNPYFTAAIISFNKLLSKR